MKTSGFVRVLGADVDDGLLDKDQAQPHKQTSRQHSRKSVEKFGSYEEAKDCTQRKTSPHKLGPATQSITGHIQGAQNVARPTTSKKGTQEVAEADATKLLVQAKLSLRQQLHGLQVHQPDRNQITDLGGM